MYNALPGEVKTQAREAYLRFLNDPTHPGLKFKELNAYPKIWSVRVSLGYRAVCKREGEELYWFWIGSHADFDRDFA